MDSFDIHYLHCRHSIELYHRKSFSMYLLWQLFMSKIKLESQMEARGERDILNV